MHDNYDYDGVLVQLWTLSLFKIEKKNTKQLYEYKKKSLKKIWQVYIIYYIIWFSTYHVIK